MGVPPWSGRKPSRWGREGFRGEGAPGGLARPHWPGGLGDLLLLHLLAAPALAARDVRVDGLVLPAELPLVVDGQLRLALIGCADASRLVRPVGPRKLADAGSAVRLIGHRSSPQASVRAAAGGR